jgi:WD40 repeat protein
MIEDRNYDLTLHFAKKLTAPLVETTGSKAKSYLVMKSDKKLNILVAFHSNTAIEYTVDIKSAKSEEAMSSKTEFGQLTSHKTAIRGVTMSANDQLFATNSFDSVKVWSVDLFQYSQKQNIEIQCKQSIDETNVLSVCILPGNKYLVLGTKDG